MSKAHTDRTVYQETIIDENGEVKRLKSVYRSKDEPEFVKLYIDCVFKVMGVKQGLNPIFIAFLRYMSWAGQDRYGGQVIYVNKAMKEDIASRLGVSRASIEKAITTFVKTGVFKRVSQSTYQVNPDIVGKGDWQDIKAIRNIQAHFDFKNKKIVADIQQETETTEDNEHQQEEEPEEKKEVS